MSLKIKKIIAIMFNNRSLNILSNDALIEQSSRRARVGIVSGQARGVERRHKTRQEVVWTLWKMAAAPYQAQWPLRQIVYFARGGGVSGIAMPHLRRRANAPLWPVCEPRCPSDVSKRAILPPSIKVLPKLESIPGPFSLFLLYFAPIRRVSPLYFITLEL